MVANCVIFDMGGVLMDFDTRALTAAFTETAEDAALLHREVFEDTDWIAMDRGGSEAASLKRMKERLPQRLHAPADRVIAHWDEYLIPNPEMNEIARELDGAGVPLYLLSNTPDRFYRFRERIPAWPLMRGALLSFEEHLLKPDPEIYRRLFSRFGLSPGSCFFVDDSQANIEAARWCGMKVCLYRGDAGEVRAALRRAGIPIAADRERAAGQIAGAGRSE